MCIEKEIIRVLEFEINIIQYKSTRGNDYLLALLYVSKYIFINQMEPNPFSFR